jgi:hypothetical protein
MVMIVRSYGEFNNKNALYSFLNTTHNKIKMPVSMVPVQLFMTLTFRGKRLFAHPK